MPSAKKPKAPLNRLIHIRLTEETHKRLRIKAAKADRSIQSLVMDLIEKSVATR